MAVDGKWKKVLLSGSNFTAAEIIASEIGATSNGSDLLFANSNGHFQSSSEFFINSNNDLEGPSFSGSFSGSLEGSGANINITFDGFAQPLTSGSGLTIVDSSQAISTTGNNILYSGSTAAHIRIHLGGTVASIGGGSAGSGESTDALVLFAGNSSGLTFIDDNDDDINDYALSLNSGLAGGALKWNGDNTPGSTGGGILEIGAGDGIFVTANGISIDSASIVSTQNGHLGVDGTGIFVNTDHFVVPSDNLDINGGTNISIIPIGPTTFANNPSFASTLDLTIGGNITFNNNIILEGDLTVINSSNVTQILGNASDLNIEDGFLFLNSGSSISNDNGGIIVDTGNNISGVRSGSAIAYVDGNSETVLGNSANRVGWALYSGSFPSDQVSTTTHTNFDTERFVDPRSHALADGPVGAPIVTVKHRSQPDPVNSSVYFYSDSDGDTLANYGAFYVENDHSGEESNVFVFVPFDE